MINFFNNKEKSAGYSMLELLLASAVGSIIIAGSYSAYGIIGKQQQRLLAFSEVQSAGMPTVRLIARDMRAAGRIAYDNNMDPVYGVISTPIVITDSGDNCCDSVIITYDQGENDDGDIKRCQITYDTDERTDPDRTAIYRTVSTLFTQDGVSTCTGDSTTDLVTDYVDDLQIAGSDNDASGNPRIVDIALLMRSRTMRNKESTFTPPDEVIGNYDYSFTDKFHRDVFTMTVNIKNMRKD